MARMPEPLPEQDRLQMIRWKQQGLSYDDITSRFAGRYSRGKIVGEITRAENAGDFQATRTVNTAINDQQSLTGGKPTFVRVFPAAHVPSQLHPPQTQTPGFVIVNRYPAPIPQPYVYQPAGEPTVIFTQLPSPPQKPFDIVEYMLKKTIDAFSARSATPQVSTQTPLTQDQIDGFLALQRQQEYEEKQRREKEEKDGAEQERERADREKALEEQRKSLRQMEETGWKLMSETRRKEQDNNKELVGLIQKQTTDNLNRTISQVNASHKDAMKVVDMKITHAVKHGEAVREEIGFLRDAGDIARDATYPQPKTPVSVADRIPGLRVYQLIQAEVHEERQRWAERERRKRNSEITIGIITAGLYMGKEMLTSYIGNSSRKQWGRLGSTSESDFRTR